MPCTRRMFLLSRHTNTFMTRYDHGMHVLSDVGMPRECYVSDRSEGATHPDDTGCRLRANRATKSLSLLLYAGLGVMGSPPSDQGDE